MIHDDILGIKDDIQRITGLRGERGMMERARDVITGGDREHDKLGSREQDKSGSQEAETGS